MSGQQILERQKIITPRLTLMNRSTLLGTLTLANRSAPVCGSRTMMAMFRLSPEMYGNGWAGSTARGVSTGKIWAVKYSASRILSSSSIEFQLTMRIPASSSAGITSSVKQRPCRSTSSWVRAEMSANCSDWVRPSALANDRPMSRRRIRPATRTM